MKILALSDLHGYLPAIPPCDLLLLGGDYNPHHNIESQISWMNRQFRTWLEGLPAKHIVAVAGNHDFVCQHAPHAIADLPWTLLQDEATTVEGLKIYGTPWTPEFYNWAFMAKEDQLVTIYSPIPEGLDILLSHGPPYGYLDANGRGLRCGSKSLLAKIQQARPKLCLFGHIHEGRGTAALGPTLLMNVALVDDRYRPQGGPVDCSEFALPPEDNY